jgi:uncharacterized protein (TIGR03083 family)
LGVADTGGIRTALVRQWRLIAASVSGLDLSAPSRIPGWRNREVLAHLAVQPSLLVRFLRDASAIPPQVSLVDNLSGTRALAEMIDASARSARDEDLDFGSRLRHALPAIEDADLSTTVTTLQGAIALEDYLRTRCVEAVVHGCDLLPAVVPDGEALRVAASALVAVLASRRPDLVAIAAAMPPLQWVDEATGRAQPSGTLRGVLPLMT